MFFSFFHILYFVILVKSDWNYNDQGPDVWSEQYPFCAKHAQSPINIITACTIYQSFKPFDFSSDYNQLQSFTLKHIGHTISAILTDKNSSILIINGGNLIGTYRFSSFHFHFGENHKCGSEHQV